MGEPRFIFQFNPDDEDGFPYEFEADITFTPYEDVREWCEEHMGPSGFDVSNRWVASGRGDMVWFRSERDAMTFRLRWG